MKYKKIDFNQQIKLINSTKIVKSFIQKNNKFNR